MNFWIQYLPRPIPFLRRKVVLHIDIPISDDNRKLHRVITFSVTNGCNISIKRGIGVYDKKELFLIEVDISNFDNKKVNEYIAILNEEMDR